MSPPRELAHGIVDLLAERGARQVERGRDEFVRTMLATVISIGTGDLRVRPDSMTSGDIGPLWKNASYTPVVSDRVLCLWLPESGVWLVLFKVVSQP